MVFKKIIFQNRYVALETPSRPPPFMANAILNFHFDYLTTSLSESHYSWYKILQNKFLANEDENAYVQLEVFGDPAPTAQWFRVTNRGVDHSSEMFTSWCRWAVKMTGTFLRAIDISSGPMELMGENETPKGFFCNTTICKTHTGRSFWAWRSARKQTRAFTGLKKENTLTFFCRLEIK